MQTVFSNLVVIPCSITVPQNNTLKLACTGCQAVKQSSFEVNLPTLTCCRKFSNLMQAGTYHKAWGKD